MAANTRHLLAELRDDHRNMALVLDLLQAGIKEADVGEDPDFELIDEIMRYMTVYADAVHHPKEDVVYAELLEHQPDSSAMLDDVPSDHRQIAELGLQLRDDVDAIVAGAAVRRDQFVSDATSYVERLRGHMQWEEDVLFRRIDEILEDRPVDVDEYEHIKDPVFELEIESGFRRLMQAIEARN